MEGFRLTKEHPGVMLAWSAVYFGGILLIAMVMMATLGPQFIAVIQKGQASSPEEIDKLASMLLQSWPALLILLLMTAFLMSVITGGVMRLVLRPEEHGFAHLRVGRTELKLTAANLLCIGIGVLSTIVWSVFAAGASQVGTVAATLAIGLFLAFALWGGVRLSLLLPTVFHTGQVSLRAAWDHTRGHFWQLFGMIVLAVIFYVIVWILFSIIGLAVVEISGGEAAMQDISRLTPLTAIAAMITLVMQLLLQVLQIVMIYGPFAVAYRDLVMIGDEAERNFG